MQSSIEFVEISDYAYAVARIRALETKLIDGKDYNALIAAPEERFFPLFTEIAGIKSDGPPLLSALVKSLEESFTESLYLVKSLILQDEVKRLISLKYDYELLKLIIKEAGGQEITIPTEISKRSNYSYPLLKSLLESGKALDTGSLIYETYNLLKNARDLTGKRIDNSCDNSYYSELFQILEEYGNGFLTEYFIREVDANNIMTALRLKAQGAKRTALRERFLPFGIIDISFLELGFDLNLEGFSSRIVFSPLSAALNNTGKTEDEGAQAAEVEKLLEEELIKYLKESLFVTFGVEPLLTYLWVRDAEVKNLRTVLLSKSAGVSPEEIKKHIRGFYG